jgi:tetratricopeptide (TPR) repeat protein
MADVWEGIHAASGTPVALKVLRWVGLDQSQAVLNEARAAAALDHAAIVPILDVGLVSGVAAVGTPLRAGSPYLAMALCRGGSLARRTLWWEEARVVFDALLGALAHAHARGVVHRDIKPSNVLLALPDDPRSVQLADFGIAQLEGSGTTRVHAGTPAFMAPEATRGEADAGIAADLYSAGRLLLSLLTGYASGGVTVGPVPATLRAYLSALLATLPSGRFRCAADARAALSRLGAPDRVLDVFAPTALRMQESSDTTWWTLTQVVEAAEVLPATWLGGGEEMLLVRPLLPLATPEPDPVRRREPMPPGIGLGLLGVRTLPLMGRTAEFAELWGALVEVTTSRRPTVRAIAGERGIGKSRLCESLAERSVELGVACVIGPAGGPDLRGALARAIAGELGLLSLPFTALPARIEAMCGDPLRASGWSELLLPGSTPTPLASMQEVAEVVRDILAARCLERAVVLWLDDVDEDAALVVAALRGVDEPFPVLALVTAREEIGALGDVPWTRLGPIPRDAVVGLLQDVVGLDPRLCDQIADRSGGVPLLAIELVAAWRASGRLFAGAFGLRAATDDLEAGADGDDVLTARATTAGDPWALEIAASLGVKVDRVEWERACASAGVATSLDTVLADAVAAGLAQVGPQGFGFRQRAFQEALLQQATRGGRAPMWHAACAVALGAEGDPWRRGRHLEAAGVWEGAFDALEAATRASVVAGALGRADRALLAMGRCLDAIAAPPEDPRRGLVRLLGVAVAYGDGRYAETRTLARAALLEADRNAWPGMRSRLQYCLGLAQRYLGDIDGALVTLEGAVDAASDEGERAEARYQLGFVLLDRGELDRARQCFDEAWAASSGDRVRGFARMGTCQMHKQSGQLAEAREAGREAVEHLARAGERSGLARALNDLGEIERLEGWFGEAERRYREALYHLRLIGHGGADVVLGNLGLLLVDRRVIEEATDLLQRASVRIARRGWKTFLPVVSVGLARCAVARDAGQEALACVESAAEGVRQTGIVERDLCLQLEALSVEAARFPEVRAVAAALATAQRRLLSTR